MLIFISIIYYEIQSINTIIFLFIQLFETVNNFLLISQLNKIDISERYFVFHFKMLSYLYTIEEHVFAFSLAIEGNTENVLQFIVPFKSIHKENHSFLEQKNVF